MGLFNKLLQINKSNYKHQPISFNQIEEDNIRVLLFRECEFKGRKVLYDTTKKNGNTDFGSEKHPPHNQLAEMVFGSVAMGFNSCSFKIHVLQPSILMFAQIFPSPRHREKIRESFSSSSSQCLDQSAIFEDSATSSTNSSASDQLSTYSTASDQIQGDSLSSLSSGNVYKKWLRSNNTNSGSSFGSMKEGSTTYHRSSKLGFVLILETKEHMLDFYMEHISLIESLFHRCRRLIEIAYTKPHTFESSMGEISGLSRRGISNLVTNLQNNCDITSDAFRVSLNSRTSFLARIFNFKLTETFDDCEAGFVSEFCRLLEGADNKETSFFMSSLVTAVLTHHLGWVRSSMEVPALNGVRNPLWGQLLSLYGAIGHPNKMSQTIITGTSREFLAKVLKCLEYFIRCCDIVKYELERVNIEEDEAIACKIYTDCYNNNSAKDTKLKRIPKAHNMIKKTFQEPRNILELPKINGLSKTKTISSNLFEIKVEDEEDYNNHNNSKDSETEDVVFVLGENETLVGLSKNVEPIDVNDNLIHSFNIKHTSLENISSIRYPSTVTKANSELNLYPNTGNKMRIIWMPMPKSTKKPKESRKSPNIMSVFKGVSENYMPDMVLQATISPKIDWIYKLKNDLALTSQQTQFGKYVEEVVAILGNIDNWEVHLMSSHTYVIDPNVTGIQVYMSKLVADMLESLYIMWKSKVPINYCIRHMEARMQEMCIRAKTMAQMLLKTPFCSMEVLNKTLHLDVNDVPLLLAISSVHSPEVTQKYGLSFQ